MDNKIDELYKNAGESTQIYLDQLMSDDYSFYDDDMETTNEYMTNISSRAFRRD